MRLRLDRYTDADVVVVGAGPAGASTAAHLAQGGARVLLLDQRDFPRDKVCGDFVGPAALAELDLLDATVSAEVTATNVVGRAALHLDGELLIRHDMPVVPGLPPAGRVVPRLRFDDAVLRAARRAGAEVRTGGRVTGYRTDAQGVTVELAGGGRLRARMLVGADGSTSLVGRLLRGHKVAPQNRIIAVRAYYAGCGGPADEAVLMFTRDSFPGYCWLFPTGGGGANVGIGMAMCTVPPAQDQLAGMLLDLVGRDPALTARLSGARLDGRIAAWPLTTYDPAQPLVGDRVLLTGDAAGLINPLNGEGIQYALASGRWAAATLTPLLAADRLGVRDLAPYASTVRRELRYDMALAGLIVQLVRCRALTPVWFEALRTITGRAATDPEYARATGGILAGILPAGEALSARVVGGTLAGAAAGSGFAMAYDTLQGPSQMAGWAGRLVRTSLELAGQAAADVGGRLRPGPAQRSRSIM